MLEDAFRRALPDVVARRDSTLVAHAQLAAEVQRLDERHHGGAARAIADQRRLSVGLGVLALFAAAVAGFAWREHRLTRALARAVAEEQRLRAEAEQQRAEAERQREALVRLGESKARLVRGFTHDVKNLRLGRPTATSACSRTELPTR